MLTLKEGLDGYDNKKILCSLVKLQKLSKVSNIDRKIFEMLISLIKMPNEKILSYSLSILANCCLKENYRKLFRELGGLPHLMVIIDSVSSNSIICRACRLLGNLSLNREILQELVQSNAGSSLMKLLEKHESLSSDCLAMAFRALRKIWSIAQLKWKVEPKELAKLLNKCLDSGNENVVHLAVETLSAITDCKKVPKRNKLKVDKTLFSKLTDLSYNQDLNGKIINCLNNLICYYTSSIWSFLEGSKIADVFITYFQNSNDVSEKTYKALYNLCTEGGIRSKIRLSGLLLRLIDTSNSKNVKILLSTFTLFQYDLDSMKMCSKNPKFVSILINNIKEPGSIQLLTVLSRLNPPARELVSDLSLNVILSHKECNGILKNIARNTEFLRPVILTGKVWQLDRAGCKMEDFCNPGYVEYLLIQLLSMNDEKREDVSLAVPFLIKASHFGLLHKLLIQYEALKTILKVLHEKPTDEKVSATVVRLIMIFKFNYHNPDNFFQNLAGDEIPFPSAKSVLFCTEDSDEKIEVAAKIARGSSTVKLEFDDGDILFADKNLLSSKSPVLNSMLNGHFAEAMKDKIQIRNCTKKSFSILMNYFNGKNDFSDLDADIYLELLSLSDRFLLLPFNAQLTENFKIDKRCCPTAYKWYRQAGHTENNRKVGKKIYECIFSSAENLLETIRDEECRPSIIREISSYLTNILKDSS